MADTKLVKVESKLDTALAKTRSLRNELKEATGVPGSLMAVGFGVSGAAISGVIAGIIGDDTGCVAGMPVEVAVGVLMLGIGVGAGFPFLVEMGGGALTGWVQGYAFQAVKKGMAAVTTTKTGPAPVSATGK